MSKEYCIMPISDKPGMEWSNKRFSGSHRHEVFGGPDRMHSIEDGLVIFLKLEMHNMTNAGIHYNKDFREYAQDLAQRTWMEFYNKTEDDFRKRYRMSYLKE